MYNQDVEMKVQEAMGRVVKRVKRRTLCDVWWKTKWSAVRFEWSVVYPPNSGGLFTNRGLRLTLGPIQWLYIKADGQSSAIRNRRLCIANKEGTRIYFPLSMQTNDPYTYGVGNFDSSKPKVFVREILLWHWSYSWLYRKWQAWGLRVLEEELLKEMGRCPEISQELGADFHFTFGD